jgi:hypothetical protein
LDTRNKNKKQAPQAIITNSALTGGKNAPSGQCGDKRLPDKNDQTHASQAVMTQYDRAKNNNNKQHLRAVRTRREDSAPTLRRTIKRQQTTASNDYLSPSHTYGR